MAKECDGGSRQHTGGIYKVHWMLTCRGAKAKRYSELIRRAWWTASSPQGERRLSCDHAANTVSIVVDLVADDVVSAIAQSRGMVLDPVSELPLPESVAVVVIAIRKQASATA